MMKVYTVRHRHTKLFMPSRMFRTSYRGWSYWEPAAPHLGLIGYDNIPRLFPTLKSAQNAIVAWVTGPKRVVTGTDGDYESGFYTVISGVESITSATKRNRNDLEIVVMNLKEIK